MPNIFLELADVLEKTAEYIETEETEKASKEANLKLTEANSLAEKISKHTGNVITDDLVEKLSEAPADVKNLISNMVATDTVDSLGGPEIQEKVASAKTETGSAEQGLLDFLST